ncbi:MAG: alpha/beta hydrolase [Candidatus Hodarchaeales archaeon]|jgi:pimeloyl-ACP methyl ester carboxylesterase
MPNKRDLSFLDIPIITSMVFHPRKSFYRTENDEQISLCFQVDKSVKVCGIFYVSSKDAPTILFFHGNGEIAEDYQDLAPIYRTRGINFLVVDYRGYGESTGTPSFSNLIKDSHFIFEEVCKYLVEKNFTGQLSLMGRSLGSACAIEIASRFQDQVENLIIESGFAYTYELFMRLGVPKSLLPEEREEEVSVITLMKQINIPTLIIHGENDFIIPVKNGYALYEHAACDKKELLIIPKAGHNDLLLVGFQQYIEAVEAFLS